VVLHFRLPEIKVRHICSVLHGRRWGQHGGVTRKVP
jgi:hypothetical protein